MTTRLAIVCDLDDLRRWVREFIDETADSNSSQVQMEWTFEVFLQWLRKRMETTDEKSNNKAGRRFQQP